MKYLLILLLSTFSSSAADPTIEELLIAADDAQRGESSIGTIEMHVKTARYERSMKMKSWAQGSEKTLIRILEPVKEAGVSTLKVDDNIWNYLPKIDRTMKVPAGMMSGSWMGSHFTNDDLVRESRLSEDFTYEFTHRPGEADQPHYVITLVPKPEAPVVWGKVVATVSTEKLPVSFQYYDEKDVLVRTMKFEDVRVFDGRKMPGTMMLIPADAPDEFTQIKYIEMDFDPDIPANMFSLQSLNR